MVPGIAPEYAGNEFGPGEVPAHAVRAGERDPAALRRREPDQPGDLVALQPRDVAGSKADDERHLAKIENKFGDYPISGFDNRRTIGIFMGWRDELAAASRRQGDYTWVVFGVVLNIAVRRGFIDRNPLAKSGRLYTSKRVDKVWSEEDEALWLERARST